MCPSDKSLRRSENTGSTSAFRLAFDVIDGDGDGKIGREDLRRFFYAVFPNGFDDDDEMFKTMISLADSKGDGFVEYDEFERVLRLPKSKQTASSWGIEVMGDVFKVMDKDGDGKLSHEDMKSYMKWVGLSVSDEDISSMIRLGCGVDGEEGVSFNGLLKILGVHFAGL